MKNIILPTMIVLFLITLSCSKEDEANSNSYDLLVTSVYLNFLDNQNQDLLDSLTPNYYSYDKMKLYYLENGKKQEVNDPDAKFPKNLKFYEKNDETIMVVFVSTKPDTIIGKEKDFDIGRSTTYLEFSTKVVDTIVTEWKRGSNYFIVQKMWYNNAKEPYDVRSTDIPYKVIKDIN